MKTKRNFVEDFFDNFKMGRTVFCITCRQYFNPRGIAPHRAKHRRRGEYCSIEYTDKSVVHYDYTHGQVAVIKRQRMCEMRVGEMARIINRSCGHLVDTPDKYVLCVQLKEMLFPAYVIIGETWKQGILSNSYDNGCTLEVEIVNIVPGFTEIK